MGLVLAILAIAGGWLMFSVHYAIPGLGLFLFSLLGVIDLNGRSRAERLEREIKAIQEKLWRMTGGSEQ